MPYIGNPPAERFTSFAYQDLTGGSGTSFTLDNAVGNPQEIEVFVNNVRQEPGVAYTVSGTALTMTGSIATTDDFYVVFQGKAIQTATHPSDRALTATDGTFTGNVGIGTSTVDSALHIEENASGVTETSGSTLKIHNTNSSGRSKISLHNSAETASGSIYYDTDSGGLALQGDTGAIVAIHTGGNNERLRVDTSGDIGIGTSSITNTSGYRNIHIDSPTSGMIMRMYANGTHVGQIQSASDQLQFNAITSIPMIFKTNNTEAMRINSSGQVLIGDATPNAAGSLLELQTAQNTANVLYMLKTNQVEMTMGFKSSTDSNFYIGTGSSTIGTYGVYLTNQANSFTSISDERKKTIIEPIENASQKVSSLRAVIGRFNHDEDDKRRSFLIAQDVQAVLPEAVSVQQDEDGTLGLSYTDVIPLLTAALKESIAKIETLETENATQATQIADLITRVTALEDV